MYKKESIRRSAAPQQQQGKQLSLKQVNNTINDIKSKVLEEKSHNKENINIVHESLKFIDLDNITEQLKDDTTQLDKSIQKADPSLYQLNGGYQLQGMEGVMRKWLYRNKQALADTDFFTIQRQQVDVKEILKAMKTSDTDEALKKFYQTIRYFDFFFGKLMEFQMVNILKHKSLYKKLSKVMSRKMQTPINLETWNLKSIVELMIYLSDRSQDLSDFIAKLDHQKIINDFNSDPNLVTENERLVLKIKEQEDLIQKLKDEQLEQKQLLINSSEQSIYNMEPNKASSHLFQQLKYFYQGCLDKCFKEMQIIQNDCIEKDIFITKLKTDLIDCKTQIQFFKQEQERKNLDQKDINGFDKDKETSFEYALREECERIKNASRKMLVDLQKDVAEIKYQSINEISCLQTMLQKEQMAKKFLLSKLQSFAIDSNIKEK